MRTLIYARYSSQLQNSRSIEDQIAVCRERSDREGWTIVEVYTDYAISGAAGIEDSQRPGLNAMLGRLEAGGVDQVLTESTDRIARHQGDAFAIRERMQFAGVRLFTLMDGVVDDITGTIKGLMDARFRSDLAARIKRGQRGTVGQGRAPAGIAYGYRRANKLDERGELVRGLREIDEDQADVLRRIFREFAAGQSPRAIAERLNAEKIAGPRGGHWASTTIRGNCARKNGILHNRLYVGDLIVNRNSKVTNPRTRRTVIRPNPEAEWIVQRVDQLRIIDDGLWQAAQARMGEATHKRPEQKRRPKHLLSGLGVCGICGGGWVKIDGEKWGCGARKSRGGCDNNRMIETPRYEAEVLSALRHDLMHPELAAAYAREYRESRARRIEEEKRSRVRIDRKLGEANRKLDRLVSAIATGAGDVPEIVAMIAQIRAERDQLAAQLGGMEALQVIPLLPGIIQQYEREIERLAQALRDDAAKLEAVPRLRALIHKIVLSPNPTARGVLVRVEGRIDAALRLATGDNPNEIALRLKAVG